MVVGGEISSRGGVIHIHRVETTSDSASGGSSAIARIRIQGDSDMCDNIGCNDMIREQMV